jgi:hypothetical protein
LLCGDDAGGAGSWGASRIAQRPEIAGGHRPIGSRRLASTSFFREPQAIGLRVAVSRRLDSTLANLGNVSLRDFLWYVGSRDDETGRPPIGIPVARNKVCAMLQAQTLFKVARVKKIFMGVLILCRCRSPRALSLRHLFSEKRFRYPPELCAFGSSFRTVEICWGFRSLNYWV